MNDTSLCTNQNNQTADTHFREAMQMAETASRSKCFQDHLIIPLSLYKLSEAVVSHKHLATELNSLNGAD